ncbi:hypothetical protein DFJ74DRAFT_240502 [Hyaloraphidium curvatum]|nr:hypothetical protein DFJ74DRAFT_240502 [Hyaloraphidium curvatum]
MPPYKAEFIADVGGVSPSANTTSYSTINDFLAAVRSVDYLVDETFLGTTDYAGFLETYGLTANSSIPFVKNKKVYRTDKLQNGEGWTAWFESAVALNHIMLADLASEVHPGLFSSYTRTFLRNVATEALNGTVTIATAAQCTGPIKYDVTCPAAVAKPAGAGALRAGSAMALAAVVAALLL